MRMRGIEYLAESLDSYGNEESPPFTCEDACKIPVQLVSNGGKHILDRWRYDWGSGYHSFNTLLLNGKYYVVKALPKDWKRGDSMVSRSDCRVWFVWQGTQQEFIGSEFEGPVAITLRDPKPADQPAQLKRANAIESPTRSKRVRTMAFTITTTSGLDPRSLSSPPLGDTNMQAIQASPRGPTWSPVTPKKQIADSDINQPISSSNPTSNSIESDLSKSTTQAEIDSFTHSADLNVEQQVNPWVYVKVYKREKNPVKMHLSDAQGLTASVKDVTMQSLFTKVEAILERRSGSVHTLEVFFEETLSPGANLSMGAETQLIDGMRMCRVVESNFEEFLGLVHKYRQLFRSNRAHVTLTAGKKR